jgi:4a-hydroxytetrahydrobiopterin dehydratase|tara:strand:- start:877 stop:1344 length:468 start_codon:yes stop_codon:yes gene_type:complete
MLISRVLFIYTVFGKRVDFNCRVDKRRAGTHDVVEATNIVEDAMSNLGQQSCSACSADAPQVTDAEKQTLLKDVPEWQLIVQDGEEQLQRVFTFKNFVQAQAFTNKVADLAEEEGHHPAILLEWGKATVRWWTHKIGGLHKNDFIMAARTDELYP